MVHILHVASQLYAEESQGTPDPQSAKRGLDGALPKDLDTAVAQLLRGILRLLFDSSGYEIPVIEYG